MFKYMLIVVVVLFFASIADNIYASVVYTVLINAFTPISIALQHTSTFNN